MKRSEMIKELQEVMNIWGQDGGFLVDMILARCEQLGMLPPIEPGRTVMDLDLGVPEWEPEDET